VTVEVFGVEGRGFGIEEAEEDPASGEGVLACAFLLRKGPSGPRSLFFRFFCFLVGI
jgi:hypothetical protein